MTDDEPYVPNELLSRLRGVRLYSVELVLNDYLHFRFDGESRSAGPVTLTCYIWPVLSVDGQEWRESHLGYADALRKLAPGIVVSTSEETGSGVQIVLDTGVVTMHPTRDEVGAEIAWLGGWADGAWMMWRPGEDSFEHLA